MALDTEGVQDQAVPIVSKILDTMGTDGDLLGRTAGPGVPTRPRGSVDTPWSPGRAGVYMLRAALKGTLFFLAKTDMPPKLAYFFGFIVTRQTALPIQIVLRFCASGYGRFKKLLRGCPNSACGAILGD